MQVDDTAGLTVPTIFVGTEGGLSIIKTMELFLMALQQVVIIMRVQQLPLLKNYLWWTTDLVFNSSIEKLYTLSLDGHLALVILLGTILLYCISWTILFSINWWWW